MISTYKDRLRTSRAGGLLRSYSSTVFVAMFSQNTRSCSTNSRVEVEIEKLLDTLTGANATLLAYANKKIEDLDNRRKTLSKAIADLSVETLSSQQIELLSGYLDDWENISFEDKRKAADGLISSISATSDYVKIEWKI